MDYPVQKAQRKYFFLPSAHLCFLNLYQEHHWWQGKAEKCPPKDSDAYFSTRPYKSKIGARISPQSRIINNRTEIIRAFVKEAIKLTGQRIQRPGNWGGFAVTPTRFEFWQGRENRLHDRFLYTLCKEEHIPSSSSPESDGWRIVRLAP